MKCILLILILLGPLCLRAQKVVEERFPLPSGQQLQLKLDHGSDIQLKGWDEQEVLIQAKVQINGGRHNDAFGINSSTQNQQLIIRSLLNEKQITTAAPDDCQGSYWRYDSSQKQQNICLDISYEVWLPKGTMLTLKTISGNVTASNLQGALDLHSISGFIDVSLPASQQATLWLKSVTGELYTNLDIKVLNPSDELPIVGYELEGQLGKGGTAVRLETISSNIYLRKE